MLAPPHTTHYLIPIKWQPCVVDSAKSIFLLWVISLYFHVYYARINFAAELSAKAYASASKRTILASSFRSILVLRFGLN